jgi:hypothetical protein
VESLLECRGCETHQNACHFLLEEERQEGTKVYKLRTKQNQRQKNQQSSNRGKTYPQIPYYTETFEFLTVYCPLQ